MQKQNFYPNYYVYTLYILYFTSNHNHHMEYNSEDMVAYLQLSTSNHNIQFILMCEKELYIFSFLHQTTTSMCDGTGIVKLYIFSFLHQTTTYR